jgi:hypothetical protein
VSAGRWSIEGEDSTNWEVSGNVAFFGGGNQLNRWDGTNADSVRLNGGGFMFDNCGSIRGISNRIEDTTGDGMILRSPGAFSLLSTYFNNLGSVGAAAQVFTTPKTKSFYAGSGNITAVVEGVDCIFFDRTNSNSSKIGDGITLHGFVRQARDHQQIRNIVRIDNPNSTWRPGRDIQVNIDPWPNELRPVSSNVDDTAAWLANDPVSGSYWSAPGFVASNSWPFILERSRFTWKGELIPQIHGKNQYLCKQFLNPYQDEFIYNINVAAVSATATAATWSGGTNSDRAHAVTYTVSSNLTATLGNTNSIRITGMVNAVNNGVFNIKSITSTTITVHNYARTSSTGDETGSSGTVVGPSPALVLDVGLPHTVYDIRVTAKSGSTEDLRVYKPDGTLLTTITTASTTKVRKYPLQGWVLV